MPTEKQIAANRRNAQLSTGPRSEAGKSRSRMNALKSGLHAESLVIRGEDPAALDQLSADYHAQFHPCTPLERDLVDTVVHNQWLIRRLRLIEAQLWAYQFDSDDDDFNEKSTLQQRYRRHPLFHPFACLTARLTQLQSRVNSLERSSHRALAALQKSSRADDPLSSSANPDAGSADDPLSPSPNPQPPKTPDPPFAPAASPAPVIGFVSRTPAPLILVPNPRPLAPGPRLANPPSSPIPTLLP